MHDNYLLYVFAPDCESRQRWVLTLKEGKETPVLLSHWDLRPVLGLGSMKEHSDICEQLEFRIYPICRQSMS